MFFVRDVVSRLSSYSRVAFSLNSTMRQTPVTRLSALSLIALTCSISITACSGRISVPVAAATAAGCGLTTTKAFRHVSDDSSTPWYSPAADDPSQYYANDGQRAIDQYDDYAGGGRTGSGGKVINDCAQAPTGGRNSQSLTFVPTRCWYQARVPGVHNTDVDTFLGCDYAVYDTNYNFNGFGGSHGGVVGVHVGPPKDGAACNGSPTSVGESIQDGNGHSGSVSDINTLFNGNKVEGWMYLGDDGNRYVQFNYNNQAGVTAGIGYGRFGGAVGTPGTYSGYALWNGRFTPGTIVKKCFSGGGQLV